MRTTALLVAVVAAAAAAASPLPAQQQPQAPQAPAPPPLEVGAVAPDFALPGATRFGLLQQPVRLSDYKGDLVVLAFFFKARTKG